MTQVTGNTHSCGLSLELCYYSWIAVIVESLHCGSLLVVIETVTSTQQWLKIQSHTCTLKRWHLKIEHKINTLCMCLYTYIEYIYTFIILKFRNLFNPMLIKATRFQNKSFFQMHCSLRRFTSRRHCYWRWFFFLTHLRNTQRNASMCQQRSLLSQQCSSSRWKKHLITNWFDWTKPVWFWVGTSHREWCHQMQLYLACTTQSLIGCWTQTVNTGGRSFIMSFYSFIPGRW